MSFKQKIKNALPDDVVGIMISIYRRINLKNWYSVLVGRVKVEFLVISVGQACNFKCRDCSNFAPVSPACFKRYDVNDIKKDLKVLFENVEYIEKLQIQGGEPLLYSDLAELIDFLYENRDKVHEIVIATNGSLIPDDSLMECLKRNSVCVRISDYGIAQESSSKLVEKLIQNNIRYYVYSFVNGKSLWYECGGKNTRAGGANI
ncbi:MAG: radical SAM protein [Clostridiales bacterium]|nr:radical SAM protein [Clostridiales bacterium]